MIRLRQRSEIGWLSDSERLNTEVLQPVDLVQQLRVGRVEVGDSGLGWPAEDDVAVEVPKIEDSNAQIVTDVGQRDVVFDCAFRCILNPGVLEDTDYADATDGQEHDNNGQAHKAPRPGVDAGGSWSCCVRLFPRCAIQPVKSLPADYATTRMKILLVEDEPPLHG